jgi:hypothetical protein
VTSLDQPLMHLTRQRTILTRMAEEDPSHPHLPRQPPENNTPTTHAMHRTPWPSN